MADHMADPLEEDIARTAESYRNLRTHVLKLQEDGEPFFIMWPVDQFLQPLSVDP